MNTRIREGTPQAGSRVAHSTSGVRVAEARVTGELEMRGAGTEGSQDDSCKWAWVQQASRREVPRKKSKNRTFAFMASYTEMLLQRLWKELSTITKKMNQITRYM